MTNTQLLDDRTVKRLETANVPIEENTTKNLKISMRSMYGYEPEEVEESLSRLEQREVIEKDSGIWRVSDARR